MKIFISWSGTRAKEAALALREWLPSVIQSLKPWVSAEDIAKGKRWSDQVSTELGECSFGIVCLTPENVKSEWLHFEAGALAKSLPGAVEEGRVSPLLLGFSPARLQGPLAQFQATVFERADMQRLVTNINNVSEAPLDQGRVLAAFEQWWQALEVKVRPIIAATPDQATLRPGPSNEQVIAEILESVRGHERSLLRLERALGDIGSGNTFAEIPFGASLAAAPPPRSSPGDPFDGLPVLPSLRARRFTKQKPNISAGWYADPGGRYAQRYHDGERWTEHVVDAAGSRTTDPTDEHAPDNLE